MTDAEKVAATLVEVESAINNVENIRRIFPVIDPTYLDLLEASLQSAKAILIGA